jgi:hypothetical protein
MTICVILAGLVYFISWLWLFTNIKENDHSNDIRTAGYSADDVIMPLLY